MILGSAAVAMQDPVPVIPLEYAEPAADGTTRFWRRFAGATLVFGWATAAVALCLVAFVDVETVLGTGPLLLATGVLLTVAGLLSRWPLAAVAGGGHCAVCLLFLLLVN